MSTKQYDICIYGTSFDGFTYLLAVGGGPLVATHGRGSDYGVRNQPRGETVTTIREAVDAALAFVPDGSDYCVHAPSSGKVIRTGIKGIL
jgi:hypothetical protein